MKTSDFLEKLTDTPEAIDFKDTMEVIETNYSFTETTFKNGDTTNSAGTNSGSCKLFAFAQLQGLSVEQTLSCFGEYYRKDVLLHPDGTDHANIRNFMQYGWHGIEFQGSALAPR